MNFWRDYLRQVLPAFWRAAALTDTLVIVVFILLGVALALFHRNAEHPSWQIALAIFILSLLVELVRMPYGLYAAQRIVINQLNDKLAQISEDRPLSFTGLTIESAGQQRPPFGPWTIERIELGFENRGDHRLAWKITEFFYELGGAKSGIPLPAGAGRYSLLARECVGYGFDVQLGATRIPATFRVGFSIEYDNIPPLNVRRMKRVLDCAVQSLAPIRYDVNIISKPNAEIPN